MDLLYAIDRTLFLFLNRTVANPVFDWLMPIITEEHNQYIPILLIWLTLMIFCGKKGRITGLLIIVIITLSDQLSSSVIKPLVGRTRPCFVVDGVRLLIDQSRSFSFPSSHATNMAAAATLFSVKYPRGRIVIISIAAAVAYSRIYVGVHYPSDLIGGAILGVLCAAVVLMAERLITQWYQNRKGDAVKSLQTGISEIPSDDYQE